MFGGSIFDDLEERDEEPPSQASKRPKSPPKSSEEWLDRHGLADWPSTVPEERSLYTATDKASPRPEAAELALGGVGRGNESVLGSLDDIKADLMTHSPWDSGFLESIDRRLQLLEGTLSRYAARFICDPSPSAQESVAGGLANITDKTFLTELCDMDLLNSRRLRTTHKQFKETKPEEGGKSADIAVFPGFVKDSETVSLPGTLEALPILDTVTKAQCLPTYLSKAWRKLFYSDASCSLFQNTFWWIWMEWFKPHTEHQARLFSSVAENFVSLMRVMDTKNKDEVFLYYPGCLAQALYSAFCHAFPKSNKILNSENFLCFLCDLTSEWISGVRSPPRSSAKWKRHILNPHHAVKDHDGDASHSIQAFTEKDVMQLSVQWPHSRLQGTRFRLPSRKSARLLRQTSTPSRATTTERPGQVDHDQPLAMGIAPGPVYECVMFGVLGRSPLLQHYLVSHHLSEDRGYTGPKVTRTQVKDITAPSISYKDLLQETATRTKDTYQNYERQMTEYNQETVTTHRRHMVELRRTEKENKKLLQHRHEVAILAERLMEKQKKGLPRVRTASAPKP